MKRVISYLLFTTLSFASWSDSVMEKSSEFYNSAKEIYKNNIDILSEKELDRDELYNSLWGNLFTDFEEGAKLSEKYNQTKEDKKWFGEDRGDIREDIESKLNDIIKEITGTELFDYKNEIKSYREEIKSLKKRISEYKELKVGAPEENLIHTTKSGYDKKIKNAEDEVKIYQNRVRIIKDRLRKDFEKIGVKLSNREIDTLLIRVDGDDIIEIILVVDVIKYITKELMNLMKANSEELTFAKKYYGMHLISCELVVYLQQKYIDRVDTKYIPKIDNILKSAKEMVSSTKSLRANERDTNRKSIYSQNIKSQKLTIEVANLYKKDLLKSKRAVKNAQRKSISNLKLSKNTYSTVLLSSNLYQLIADSKEVFNEISKIQIPDITPFTNSQMEKKYLELTSQITKE